MDVNPHQLLETYYSLFEPQLRPGISLEAKRSRGTMSHLCSLQKMSRFNHRFNKPSGGTRTEAEKCLQNQPLNM